MRQNAVEDLSRLYDFTGRTILVTGGTGILGGAMAEGLVAAGANVVLLARNSAKAEATLARLAGGPGRAMAVAGDVLDRASLEAAAETITKAWGPVDTLVNCAGVHKPEAGTNAERNFFDLPADLLREVVDVNLLGTVLPCQVFGRGMASRGEGVILNVSSMNAYRPLTRVVAYAAAKAGVSNFTQWLAVHMAQTYSPRIRVNAIAPGFFLTPLNHHLLMDETTGELSPRGKSIIAHTPQGRFGAPDELVGTTLWLLSPASAFVTGIVVPVDGGFSAFSGV
jgi:NAD(P)-dependent dehydrogenase (short-subunit alcohol dehydrogenase family)